MKLAVQGCSHGELSAIYASVLKAEAQQHIKVDALLLCGDFQAIRNHADLHALAVPAKYRQLGSFHAYYSGQLVAPILTLVIGGNHEASNYMHELYHGGWLAPNIYYLGAAGAVDVGGLTIAGISGIYKSHDYRKARFETIPYDTSTIRSCYHTRIFDILRLKMMSAQSPAVVMSHDWPNTIERWGNTASLIQKKPYFKEEIETKTLGSPPLLELLKTLKPKYWFSAHLHVKFAAIYPHNTASQAVTEPAPVSVNPEAIDIDIDSDKEEENLVSQTTTAPDTSALPPTSAAEQVTRFLALHKCVPQSDFLQFLDVDAPEDEELEARKAVSEERVMPSFRFNKRWLAVTKIFHPFFSAAVQQPPLPAEDDTSILSQIEEAERWIEKRYDTATLSTRSQGKRKQDEPDGSRVATPTVEYRRERNALDIHPVQHFIRTAPAPFEPGGMMTGQPSWYTNPQTESFCHFLDIENKINPRPKHFPSAVPNHPIQAPPPETTLQSGEQNPDALDIDLDDLVDESADAQAGVTTLLDDDELNARWKEGTG